MIILMTQYDYVLLFNAKTFFVKLNLKTLKVIIDQNSLITNIGLFILLVIFICVFYRLFLLKALPRS